MSIKKILIVSPHPDDECLGLAGTILKKKSQGYKVINIFVTSLKNTKFSDKKKQEQLTEIKNCQKILKIDKIIFLIFHLPHYKELVQKIIKMISEIFTKESQRSFFAFVNDIHDDHFISHKAGLACCKWFEIIL